MSVRVIGLERLEKRLLRLSRTQGLDEALRGAAERLREQAAAELENGQAVPGEAAALRRSLKVTRLPGGNGYALGSQLALAWQLEFGTQARLATPWLGPAIRDGLPRVNANLAKLLKSWIGRAPA